MVDVDKSMFVCFSGQFPNYRSSSFFLALLSKLVVFFVTAPVCIGVTDLGSDYVRKLSGEEAGLQF